MSAVREELVKNAEAITWVPENIKEGRFGEWLRGIKDWAISRDRYWGTPIPIWVCDACGIRTVVESSAQLERLSGKTLDDLHKPYIDEVEWSCECGAGKMRRTPEVLDAFARLRGDAVATIRSHVVASARGMARFVARTEGNRLTLDTVEELKDYCYVVAGLVGEMLTDLFLIDRPALAAAAPFLRERAARFGEGLQLVNILKDADADADEGRRYLPEAVPRAEVFALARRDLAASGEYVLCLQRSGAPRGLVEFNALPSELAWAALRRVEEAGPGSKVSRPEVFRITRRVRRALDRGESPVKQTP